MCTLWWGVGIWLYWGHGLYYDETVYVSFSQQWTNIDIKQLASSNAGTLVRPYIYPAFLSICYSLLGHAPSTSFGDRIYISAFQLALFAGSVLRLAQVARARYGRYVGQAVLAGLLGMPFPVFTQVEVLSEGISLSVFCWLAAALIGPAGAKRRAFILARLGLVSSLMVTLVLIRSAFLPVGLLALALTVLPVIRTAIGQCVGSLFRVCWYVLALAVPAVVLTLPQGYLMIRHEREVGGDPYLWGIGSAQLEWSLTLAKYATSVVRCDPLMEDSVRYPMPKIVSWYQDHNNNLLSTNKIISIIVWYLIHPIAIFIHLFQSINYDFPTTYITTYNIIILRVFNGIGMFVVASALVTLASSLKKFKSKRKNTINAYIKEDKIIPLTMLLLWMQTAGTAVETRFGIIPWSGLSVVAAHGARVWLQGFVKGTADWRAAGVTVVLMCVGLGASFWLLSLVESVQSAIAAGC